MSPPQSPASPPASVYRPSPYTAPSLQAQLASLKAFYEAKGAGVGPGLGAPLLPPGLSLPVSALPGFPRPPVSSLPPFLGLGPGAGAGAGAALPGLPGSPHQPPHGVPREFPLHPWFINRHRFPLGKLTKLSRIFS